MPKRKPAAAPEAATPADDGFPFDLPPEILDRPILQPADRLPPHLERFCHELLVPGQTAATAALKAGAPEGRAKQTARDWKQRKGVQDRLAELYHYQAMRAAANADRVMAELARVAFSDVRRFLTADHALKAPDQWSADDAAAVREIEVDELTESDGEGGQVSVGKTRKLKLHDKMAALRILAAHHRLMDEAAGPKVVMNVNIQL